MARITFLLETSPSGMDLGDVAVLRTLRTLTESQHEVTLITSQDFSPPPNLVPQRLMWLRPVKSWQTWNLPWLLLSLVARAPDVVHALPRTLSHPLMMWRLLPAALHAGLASPLVVSPFVVSPEENETQLQLWDRQTRFPPTLKPTPVSCSPVDYWYWPEDEAMVTLIPGPFSAVASPEKLLRQLLASLALDPNRIFLLGWSWDDLSLAQRRIWRRKCTNASTQGRIRLVGTPSEDELLGLGQRAGEVWTEHLPAGIWQDLAKALRVSDSPSSDAVANELSRFYSETRLRL